MNTERIYRGKITSIRQVSLDTLGYRYYEVNFSGKKMLYICHKKTTLPFSVGDRIRFTGQFRGESGKEYFQILQVIDEIKVEKIDSQNLTDVLSEKEKEDALADGHLMWTES